MHLRPQHLSLSLLVVGVIGLQTGHAQAPQPLKPAKQVQRDVEAIARSLYSGDVDVAIRYTHPAILKALGGVEAARASLKEAMASIAKAEMKIESFSFPHPPEFFEGGGRKFVFVPTLTIMSAKGARLESLNFQFGVLEPGTREWKYLEGSRMKPELAQSLFPGFPKDRAFPPFYRKKL